MNPDHPLQDSPMPLLDYEDEITQASPAPNPRRRGGGDPRNRTRRWIEKIYVRLWNAFLTAALTVAILGGLAYLAYENRDRLVWPVELSR